MNLAETQEITIIMVTIELTDIQTKEVFLQTKAIIPEENSQVNIGIEIK